MKPKKESALSIDTSFKPTGKGCWGNGKGVLQQVQISFVSSYLKKKRDKLNSEREKNV